MRNTRAVYQKLREVRYFHLVELYKRLSKRVPENCRYNYPYVISGENNAPVEIRLCLLHQPNLDLKTKVIPHLIDVCQESRHSAICNGFIPRYQKEDMKKIFEEDLKNKKYPDICALEWVLEQSFAGPAPLMWIQKIYYRAKKGLLKKIL
jgi:hypothetical protein